MTGRTYLMNSWNIICVLLCLYEFEQVQMCSCPSRCDLNGAVFPGSQGNKVNVAYGKKANMSSIFPRDGGSGAACVAVNGRTGTVWKSASHRDVNCVHTADFDYHAWWLVDLAHNYTVKDITIYRRKETPRRMSGLSVYVDGQLCYSFPKRSADTLGQLDALPERIDITCTTPLVGSVVRLQKHDQERIYEEGNHLINICEVQIWACKPGRYGEKCNLMCSDHCKDSDTCDNYSGTCTRGCKPGWTPPYCDQRSAGHTVGIGLGALFGIAAFFALVIGRCKRKPRSWKPSKTKAASTVSFVQDLELNISVDSNFDYPAAETVDNARNEEAEYVNIVTTKRNTPYINHLYSL